MSGGVGHGLVGGGIQEFVQVGRVVRLHPEEPGGIGVLIDAFRRIGGVLVYRR